MLYCIILYQCTIIVDFYVSHSFEGSWWMVDLGSDIDVKKILVVNRPKDESKWWSRLSKTDVTLLDKDDNIIWHYYIDDGDKAEIVIPFPSAYRHFCKIEKCPDTTSQVRINQQEGDDNDTTPFQLDEREDPKKLSMSSIVNPSRESNSMEIENSHDYDSTTFLSDEEMQNWQPQEPPHHTERDSLSSLSSSVSQYLKLYEYHKFCIILPEVLI